MGGFWITIGLLSIIITAWESTAITNKRRPQQGGPVRNFRHIAGPSSANIHTDWEVGLREATNQALLREGYQEPNLRDRILEAPLIGRQDTATPFGDIAVLARGQLYIAHGGNFAFVQDQHHNDCDDCHNARSRCIRSQCEVWKAHQNERLVALWTVKRLRHRDFNNIHRYELEYTISPIGAAISEGFVTRDGHFDYAIPGHVFVVKTGEKQPTEPHPTIIYNRKIPHRHFKPEVLIGVSPDGHKHILHSYPGFYTSFPVHPTYHQQGYSTNDPKEIELYKALIESLAAKTSTTQKVENGPHRFSLNHYGGLPTPNKVYSTNPSYDSFLSPQTPLVQLSTGQVVPLTDITPTYVPTTVYQPDKATNPMVLNMVATKPTDLNTQAANPPTEGAYPRTEPQVTQTIKTTFHYFTPVDDHLLTTNEVKEMKMSFQTTATTKETTAEYHKPSTEKPTTRAQEDEADFLFPIAEKSTVPSKTTKKADKPTHATEADFLFPIEPVTAPSKVTKKYHSTITATDSESQLTSSTRKISTTESTTVEISTPKSTTVILTTPKTTTIKVTTPQTTAPTTTMAKATDNVNITTKTPRIIRPKTSTTKIARPKTTTTKIARLKTTTTKKTTSKPATTRTTTGKSTATSKLTTSTTPKPTTNKMTTQKLTTTPKSTTTEMTTAISSRMTEPEPTTTKMITPNPTTTKTTTPNPTTTKTTTPNPTTTKTTTPNPTTTKTTTPNPTTTEITTSTPTSTKVSTLKSTTTETPTQTATVLYPTTRFTQQTTLQEEIEDSDYSILPEVAPTKPMKAVTSKPLADRSESNNQLQRPAQDTDTTIPFSATIAGTQQTQESTRYEVKTTEADQTTETSPSNVTLKTVTPTEETTPGITTRITQGQTEASEETTENDRKTQKQTDSTAIPTISLPPTLKFSTTTKQYSETTKTPETTHVTETMLEKHITEADSEPTTTYEDIPQYTKPTTKMSTIRTKPTVDDFLTGNGKMKIPSITKPMNTDYDEDDIFGSIEAGTTPTKATTRKITESELAGELFGNRRRSPQPLKPDTTKAEGTKIIYANFFEASTTPMTQITEDLDTTAATTELYKTTLDLRPLTSQSYATSISFEVNKKNKTDLVENVEYVPAIMATVNEVMKDNEGYTVYKAELPTETSTLMSETESPSLNTKKAFDHVALQLVNHARSIDYLSMNNENRTVKSKYKRRRNYIPKNRRANKRKN